MEWLYDRGSTGITTEEFSLKSMNHLLAALDNPQNATPAFHVAGTNGKGSTSHFLHSVLSRRHRVGLFISPFMDSILESISINGVSISREDFLNYLNELIPIIEAQDREGYHCTYFEVLTTIMFLYFRDEMVDFAVLEVGLGGILDSTNVIEKPLASLITTISLDHTQILGDSLGEIASAKGGIIKEGRPVYVYPQEPEAEEVLRAVAEEKHSPYSTFSPREVQVKEISLGKTVFDFRGYQDVSLSLTGAHQAKNAALALMVLEDFREELSLSREDIYQGLRKSSNPGRMEVLQEEPLVLVDGSHNPQSIVAMKETLRGIPHGKIILGFSLLRDKDAAAILRELSGLTDTVVLTPINYPGRAYGLDELRELAQGHFSTIYGEEDLQRAYERSLSLAAPGDVVLWCGSLYLVRDLLHLKKK